jgi:mRNA interferase RelE/StbE
MVIRLRLTKQALSDLGRLDKRMADKIVSKLEDYEANGHPLRFSKPLRGELSGLFRFRIGDYRAIFRKESTGMITILFILNIKHRKEVYD